jgi:hypothetical protein
MSAEQTMQRYWKFCDGRAGYVRSSEDEPGHHASFGNRRHDGHRGPAGGA